MFIKQNLKIKKDVELTNALNVQLGRINESMVPLKKKWAESYMNYNKVTLASYDWRYKEYETTGQIKSDNDNPQKEFWTKEQKYGKYIVSTVAKEKCDQYIQEYCSRDTISNSRFNQQDNAEFVSKKMNNIFGSTQFNEAKNKAISDSVIKGTGFMRNRVYVPRNTIDAESILDRPTRDEKPGRTKHFIEHVDIEDVYIDPCSTNINEMFISTPYTDLDVIRMLPELEKYIPNLYQQDALNRIDNSKRADWIMTQDLPFYKIGERMVEIYNMYESQKFTGYGAKNMQNIMERWYSPQFLNGLNYYFKNTNKYTNRYRINEYYKLVGKPRYIMYIGQYILLDLDYIPEYTVDDILCRFYSNKLTNDTVFGKSLIELIDTEFAHLNYLETKIKRITQEASSTLLIVNNKFLSAEHKNKPIKLDETTIIGIDSSSLSPNESAAGIGNPIQPINMVNPNLQILMSERAYRMNNINMIIPATYNLTIQQSKEQIMQEYHSRDPDINYFLIQNSINISKFSNTVARCVIQSLIHQSDDFVQDENTESNPKLLIVRQTLNEIAEVKDQLNEIYSKAYLDQIEQLKEKIKQSEEFQAKAGELSNQIGGLAQSKFSEAEPEMTKSMPFDARESKAKEFEQKTNEDIFNEIENLLNQFLQEAIAKSGLKPIQDNNIYIAVDEMLEEIEDKQLMFEFKFDKSKAEIRKNIIDILSIPKIFPTAQLAIKPNVLLSQYLSTFDMDIDNAIDQEAPSGTEAQLALSKKQTVYLDPKNSPVAFIESFARDNNIPIETLTDVNHPAYAALSKILGLEQQYRSNLGEVAVATDQLQAKQQADNLPPVPEGLPPEPSTVPNE